MGHVTLEIYIPNISLFHLSNSFLSSLIHNTRHIKAINVEMNNYNKKSLHPVLFMSVTTLHYLISSSYSSWCLITLVNFHFHANAHIILFHKPYFTPYHWGILYSYSLKPISIIIFYHKQTLKQTSPWCRINHILSCVVWPHTNTSVHLPHCTSNICLCLWILFN